MKIGYPCKNRSIGCTASSTFRLSSYSSERLINTVRSNLDCLQRILEYNVEMGFLFFRISSDTIPFASHPACDIDWPSIFKEQLQSIGKYIKDHDMRISMHPDQFTLINSPNLDVIKRGVKELSYHALLLDMLELGNRAKIQIHVGGVYGDKNRAITRFIQNYNKLPKDIRKRLIIENDDRLYNLQDCLSINEKIGIPVLFDNFHHFCFNSGEPHREAMESASFTWTDDDGILMVDYSNQQRGERPGKHAESIDMILFKDFLKKSNGLQFDCMFEIKDKEISALKALEMAKQFSLL